jgi:hypothetical protein
MDKAPKHNLEGAGMDAALHEEILAGGRRRFPEESYQQLLRAGASEEEALKMLGYSAQRLPLEEADDREPLTDQASS